MAEVIKKKSDFVVPKTLEKSRDAARKSYAAATKAAIDTLEALYELNKVADGNKEYQETCAKFGIQARTGANKFTQLVKFALCEIDEDEEIGAYIRKDQRLFDQANKYANAMTYLVSNSKEVDKGFAEFVKDKTLTSMIDEGRKLNSSDDDEEKKLAWEKEGFANAVSKASQALAKAKLADNDVRLRVDPNLFPKGLVRIEGYVDEQGNVQLLDIVRETSDTTAKRITKQFKPQPAQYVSNFALLSSINSVTSENRKYAVTIYNNDFDNGFAKITGVIVPTSNDSRFVAKEGALVEYMSSIPFENTPEMHVVFTKEQLGIIANFKSNKYIKAYSKDTVEVVAVSGGIKFNLFFKDKDNNLMTLAKLQNTMRKEATTDAGKKVSVTKLFGLPDDAAIQNISSITLDVKSPDEMAKQFADDIGFCVMSVRKDVISGETTTLKIADVEKVLKAVSEKKEDRQKVYIVETKNGLAFSDKQGTNGEVVLRDVLEKTISLCKKVNKEEIDVCILSNGKIKCGYTVGASGSIDHLTVTYPLGLETAHHQQNLFTSNTR